MQEMGQAQGRTAPPHTPRNEQQDGTDSGVVREVTARGRARLPAGQPVRFQRATASVEHTSDPVASP